MGEDRGRTDYSIVISSLVVVLGSLAIAIGILGIVAPEELLRLGRSLETTTALYVIGAIRVAFGLLLIRAAAIARTPVTFRILGGFLIVMGALTPLFGVERYRALLESYAAHGYVFLRAGASVAAAFGIFLIFAVTSQHLVKERRR